MTQETSCGTPPFPFRGGEQPRRPDQAMAGTLKYAADAPRGRCPSPTPKLDNGRLRPCLYAGECFKVLRMVGYRGQQHDSSGSASLDLR